MEQKRNFSQILRTVIF